MRSAPPWRARSGRSEPAIATCAQPPSSARHASEDRRRRWRCQSGLDTAPLLSPDLRPTVSAGDVLRGPVGSSGVRKAIETFQPLLGVHGHIHESGGERKIGRTVCVNAGSEANHGILRGFLVDLSEGGVERTLRVEG